MINYHARPYLGIVQSYYFFKSVFCTKIPEHSVRKSCEFFGYTENVSEESVIIFHECSSNVFENTTESSYCGEKHIGNTPRSIMTKGTSTEPKSRPYGNFHPGRNDKLMITYRRESSHDYTMSGACAVLYQGEMHFFGGKYYSTTRFAPSQHFVIERQRSGQLVKMTKKKNLDNELSGRVNQRSNSSDNF